MLYPDHDLDTTMIFRDEYLEIENSWARESSEALTLEFEENNSIEELVSSSKHQHLASLAPLQSQALIAP